MTTPITKERLEIMLAETLGTTAARGEQASIEVTASIFVSVLTEVLASRKAAMDAEPVSDTYKLNFPVIPDGWVMVPVEPTESMIVEGFESEPDESFSDQDVWEEYQAMSGCGQAAHRAKLCWAAMLAAAPKQDKKA